MPVSAIVAAGLSFKAALDFFLTRTLYQRASDRSHEDGLQGLRTGYAICAR
jgi:hypothetical protein